MAKNRAHIDLDPVHARVVASYPKSKSDPRPYWRAVVYRDGREHKVWNGRGTYDEVHALLLGKIQRGELEAREDEKPPGAPATVYNLLACWLHAEKQQNGDTSSTFKAYKGRAAAFKATIGGVPLDRVTPATLQDHVSARSAAGKRSTTIANELIVLGAAWRWGYEAKLVTTERPPVPRRAGRRRRGQRREGEKPNDQRPKVMPTVDEVGMVLEQLTGWARIVGYIVAGTGMRIGEVANLTWANVDLEHKLIAVPDLPGCKTGARNTAMPGDLVAELRAWKPDGALDTDRIVPVARRTVAQMWSQHYLKRACKAANVRRITSHAFRRFSIQHDADHGVDVLVSAESHGNSPEIQWKHYREVTVDHQHAAAKRSKRRIPRKGKVLAFKKQGRG